MIDHIVKIPGYTAYNFKKNYEDAVEDCARQNGNLVSDKHTVQELYAVSNMLGQYGFVGAFDNDGDNTFNWYDGSIVTSEFWNSNEPNGDDEHCTSIINRNQVELVDISCGATVGYSCEG